MKQQAHIIDFEHEKAQLKKEMGDIASSDSLEESEKRLQASISGMSDLSDAIRSRGLVPDDRSGADQSDDEPSPDEHIDVDHESLNIDVRTSSSQKIFDSDIASPARFESDSSEQPHRMTEEEIRALARKRLQRRQAYMNGGASSDSNGDGPSSLASDAHSAQTSSAEGDSNGVASDHVQGADDESQSVVDRGRSRVNEMRKKHRRARADRQFDRTVDTSKVTSANDDGATPHAAVYEGKMGRSQRKSGRMQQDRWDVKRNSRYDKLDTYVSRHKPRTYVVTLVAACLAVAMVLIYQPTKQYYVAMRTQQQVQAQYDAQQSHSDQLQAEVDNLQTDEGIEDRARQQYGMVKNGENAVRVQGDGVGQEDATQQSTSANASASISKQNHVSAPDTWYSGVLDKVFGYTDDD